MTIILEGECLKRKNKYSTLKKKAFLKSVVVTMLPGYANKKEKCKKRKVWFPQVR